MVSICFKDFNKRQQASHANEDTTNSICCRVAELNGNETGVQ